MKPILFGSIWGMMFGSMDWVGAGARRFSSAGIARSALIAWRRSCWRVNVGSPDRIDSVPPTEGIFKTWACEKWVKFLDTYPKKNHVPSEIPPPELQQNSQKTTNNIHFWQVIDPQVIDSTTSPPRSAVTWQDMLWVRASWVLCSLADGNLVLFCGFADIDVYVS